MRQIMTTKYTKCETLGHDIYLHQDPSVFAPNLTTSFLTAHIDRNMVSGRTALDLGCGSGPIAIGLALSGAKRVYAVDLMQQACDLARRNALLNGVENIVTVLQGNLFEPVDGQTFDLIVDDVSGVAEEVARLSSWFPESVPSGGFDGTSHAVRMLEQSPAALNKGGVLIFPVLSLSRSSRIVHVAKQIYGHRLELVASKRVPFNAGLRDALATLEKLRSANMIEFHQVRSRFFWILDVYRAWAP